MLVKLALACCCVRRASSRHGRDKGHAKAAAENKGGKRRNVIQGDLMGLREINSDNRGN